MSIPWQLLAVDLDGTLISWHGHRANDEDFAALRRALDAGIRVTICTGRTSSESAGVLAALQLNGPGVFINGATLADMATGCHLDCAYLDPALADELIDFFGGFGHAVLVLADDPQSRLARYVQSSHAPAHQATVDWQMTHRVAPEIYDAIPADLRPRLLRVGIVTNVPEAPPIVAQLAQRFGGRIVHNSIYSQTYDCQVIEALPPSVNKWQGIVRLCRRQGLDPQRVVTIGDDSNDIPMLENATLSFAVASARPEIQKRAKRVTRAQRDCGVAHVVDGLLNGDY